MRMSPSVLVFGSLAVIWAAFLAVVLLPTETITMAPSDIWRPYTKRELRGRQLYIANGCTYCHSQYVRTQDWDAGSQRLSVSGDYRGQRPHLLGSERTGPDLSQQAGEHPDDWHLAHFINPRSTRPLSLMPRFEFVGKENMNLLTAYVQSLGGKAGDYRVSRQEYYKQEAVKAYRAGPVQNIAWLHAHVPDTWLYMPNPYPADGGSTQRGLEVYQYFCVSCHGAVGDGHGAAAASLSPPPFDFTTLKGNLPGGRYLGGLIYYQVMNGITGTAMPYFKRDLESAKIWDVSNFIAANFVAYTDYQVPPFGIDAAYVTPRDFRGPFVPPPGEQGEP